MGKVEEERYVCKVCGKVCVSGRSLGGHMTGHLGAASRKTEMKRGGGSNGDQKSGYGLRENLKKSRRIPIPESCLLYTYTWPCEECGKEFGSWRALSGHMRTHSKKKEIHECKKCGKGFDSMMDMFGHMMFGHVFEVEDICVGGNDRKGESSKRGHFNTDSKKRSRDDGGDKKPFGDVFSGFKIIGPVSKKLSTISSRCSLNEYNKGEAAAFEVEEDMEEVAGILIMLSNTDFDFDKEENGGVCELDDFAAAKDEAGNELDFMVPNAAAANEEPWCAANANQLADDLFHGAYVWGCTTQF